jgi:hypothetical protein
VHGAYNPIPGLGEATSKSMDAVGDIRPRPTDGRRRCNLSQVALLGRALDVVRGLHNRHIQILQRGKEKHRKLK